MEMSAGVAAAAAATTATASGLKRRWIKYYCEECESWETREMFEVVKFEASSSSPSASTVWSWGCAKLIRHGTFQSFRVEQLNNADGHDVVAPKLDFPSASPTPPVPAAAPAPVQDPPQAPPPSPLLDQPQQAEVEVLPANSNGSSRPKRNVRSAYARESPLNSQGGVTSSSPDEVVLPHENGTSKDVAPESPAVIDAEQQHENGVHKRPRRLTAGDRGLAQALQFERPRKVATPKAAPADVKPSPPSLAAAMKRPKRVTAGLKGIAIAAENAKSGTPRQQPIVKKEPRKDQVHQVSVQTRSASASKPSKKNKKVGDLY